jgi:UDP-N-acetyl-D-glucosamine dehydrogenase
MIVTPTAATRQQTAAELDLRAKIRTRKARAGIIGLGYVGLPLAVELAKAGFRVTGLEIDESKCRRVNEGDSYVGDIPSAELQTLTRAEKVYATTDFSAISELDTISVCVPTPLRKTKDPDLSFVVAACENIARYIHAGMLILVESTTYPGTTTELILPILEKSGLKAGVDFHICFSPERVDPGNPKYQTANIPKVIGGYTPTCTELGCLFYSQAVESVVPVSSPSVAEMVKLLENTFRMINIGMVNELAIMCDRMGIDVWEVIDAAATKPFGFMPFYPGPGLGGHCIPVDPHYLAWKTRQAGIEPRFIELASDINARMPEFVVRKIQNGLNDHAKPVKNSHVHVLGVAYKRDIDDMRESPALDIIHLLQQRGAKVTYSDPHVPHLRVEEHDMEHSDPQQMVPIADCVVIVTDHACYDYPAMAAQSKLIVDARNALKGHHGDHIIRL